MAYSLVINARNMPSTSFFDLEGRCIFERYPGEALLFVHQANAADYARLTHCRIEYFRDLDDAAMLAVARRIHADAGIVSVATLDERLVGAAAGLRTSLGLPGLDVESARYYRDKVLMKRKLHAAGIRVPRFVADLGDGGAAALELLADCGRIVVKPHDGFGSMDVSFVDSAAQLHSLIHDCDDPLALEAEEFITGTLYHSNSVIVDGRAVQTAIAEYLPGMGNIDFGRGTPFVSLMEIEGALHDRMQAFTNEVIAAFGLRDGVTHLELFHADSGEIVFCEMGIRPGGGGIVQMIEHQLGTNLSLAALLAEEGRASAAIGTRRADRRRAGLVGIRNIEMGLVSLAGTDSFADTWIRHTQFPVKDGQFKTPASHCTDFVALFIVDVEDRTEFIARVAELQSRVDAVLTVVPL